MSIHSGLLSKNPLAQRRTKYHYDHAQDKVFVETRQETTDIIELNKRRFNDISHPTQVAENGEHVASIPLVVWEDLMRRGIAYDNKKLNKWLDDPANRCFRTHPMRLTGTIKDVVRSGWKREKTI